MMGYDASRRIVTVLHAGTNFTSVNEFENIQSMDAGSTGLCALTSSVTESWRATAIGVVIVPMKGAAEIGPGGMSEAGSEQRLSNAPAIARVGQRPMGWKSMRATNDAPQYVPGDERDHDWPSPRRG